jgi:acyl-CoA thioesterase I
MTGPLRILCMGNSITDAGRTNDTPPLGNGYVARLKEMIETRHPSLLFEILNKGICGNTIEGLALRWQTDVIDPAPDILTVLIGINDAHVTQNHPSPEQERISHFLTLYDSLIRKTKDALPAVKILLMTPFYICPDSTLPVLKTTEKMIRGILDLAERHTLPCLNLHASFQSLLKESTESRWASDRVHPTSEGHTHIAEQIFKTCLNHTFF